MASKTGSRPTLGAAMLGVFLVALVLAVAIQERRIASLEAMARRSNSQNVQLANVINQARQAQVGEMHDLRREIETSRRGPVAPVAPKPAGSAAGSPQGAWILQSVERGGQIVNSGATAAKVRVFVDGDAYRTEEEGKVLSRWTIRLDPARQPAEFDATIEEGRYKGQVYRGIYRVEGDRWTYAHGPPGADRPTAFASPAGSKTSLVVARREGAP